MPMANIKKVVAMLLAILMIFSSMTVLASADGTGDSSEESSIPHAGTVSVYTKFYRENGEDEISDGGKVAPGEKIKARIYMGTTFNTAGSELLFYYDKNFFDIDYSDQTQLTGNIGTGYTVMAISNLESTSSSAEESEGTIRVTTECDGTSLRNLAADDWFFEIDLTVAANAATADSDATGSLYLKASNLVTPTNQSGSDVYSWSQTDDFNPSFIKNSYQFTLDTDYTFNSVTVKNTVTFNAGTEENAETQEVEGVVGESCTVPTFKKDNYTLTAWQSETGAELAADATTFTMPNIDGVVYTAVWSTDLTVRFDTDGGSEIADIEGHYSGETWADAQKPKDPTKTVDGYDYEFMGWLDANKNLLDALPDTYPPVDEAGSVYTYTAKWEKIVNVAFYSEGNQVASYKGNEGTSWVDGTATPKYVLDTNTQGAISAVGKLTRVGYSFVGWDLVETDGTTDGKADTLPDVYPSTNTSYKAIWKADAVAFEYYFDNTASIQKDNQIDKAAVSAIVSDSSKLLADESHSYGSVVTIPQITEGEYVITSWVDEDGNVYTAGQTYTFSKTDLIKLAASATELSTSGNLTATFNPDGGTINNLDAGENYVIANLKFGDKIEKPTAVTKEGYTFLGWEPDQNTMGETNLVFTAIWSKQEHNAVFMFNNGTGTQIISYSYGDNIIAPVDPERDGYTFAGWDLNDDGVADYTADTIYGLTMGTEDMVFSAVWKTVEYTITYYKNEAKTIDAGTDKVEYFGVITPMAKGTGEKTGYTQTGWVYYDADSKEYAEIIFNSDGTIGYNGGARNDDDVLVMPAYNLVAVPTFERNSYVLTTVFNNDVDEDSTNTIEYDAEIENEPDPEKEGYIFKGWIFTNADKDVFAVMNADGKVTSGTTDANGQLHMPAYNLTATAQWEIESYSLTYNYNGNGESTKTYSEKNGNAVPYKADIKAAYQPAENPTWEGYTFTGWTYADADGVVYAKYVVSYAEDGTATGHFEDKDGATVDTITMPAYDLIATAQWTVNKYKLTYKITGDIQAKTETTEVEYGAEVKVAAIPTEKGYTFNVNEYGTTDGWKVESGLSDKATVQANYTFKMPANDVTFTGSFEENEYKVTYYVDGTQYETTTAYKYKADVDPKEYPVKEGYTFSGWETADVEGVEKVKPGEKFSMPANDVTINGKFTINNYTVTVKPENSEEEYTKQVEYNDTLGGTNLPKTPKSKTGYEFKGWKYTDGEGNLYATYNANSGNFTNAKNQIANDITMPAYDLTCTAIWNTLDYTIKFLYEEKGAEYKTITGLKVDDTIDAVTNPEKVGYTFASWSKTVPATLTAEFITANADADRVITIYAMWNINEYTISYSDGVTEGTTPKKVVYNTDISANMPANPTRTGYTFKGWTYSYDKDGTSVTYGKIDIDKDGKVSSSVLLMPAYALTATAVWEANEYTYTFDANNGTFGTDTTKDVTDVYDANITSAIEGITKNPPTRYGYVFKGWATTKDATVADVELSTITTMALTENVTYFAVWEKGKFTVTYKYNDPTDSNNTKTEVVENVEFESTPTVWKKTFDGYDFDGWYTADITGERTRYTPGSTFTMPGKDVTFEATFSAGDNYIYYYKLATTDTDNIGYRKYLTDGAIGTSDVTATNTGYTFTGWIYYSKEDNTKYAEYVVDTYNTDGSVATGHFVKDSATVDTITMPGYDLCAVAQWKINTYTVTYEVTGIDGKIESTTSEPVSKNYNQEVEVDAKPSETGFTFKGWTVEGLNGVTTLKAGDKFNMPANNVTIKGYWEANTYTITFDARGGAFGTKEKLEISGAYLDDVTEQVKGVIENPPTWQYHTFKGWTNDENGTSAKYTTIKYLDTTIKENKTYYAVWEDTKYVATYNLTNLDGTVTSKTQKLTYGASGTAIEPTAQTGYSFNGWYTTDLTTDSSKTTVEPNGTFTMPGKDITFTGSYSPITYTVNYKFYVVKAGVRTPLTNKDITATYKIGDTVSKVDTTYEGHTATYWLLDDDTTTPVSLGSTFTSDVITKYFSSSDTITIRCDYKVKAHTVYFYYGSESVGQQNISYNTELAEGVTTTYNKDGYDFNGWKYYTDKNMTSEYTGKTMPDAPLYASVQLTPINYTITFDANGGAFSSDKTSITAGYETDITTKLAEITAPTWEGHEFKGWAESETATADEVVTIPTTMGKDKTYFAVWQVESYKVTFNVEGKTNDVTYTYGEDLTADPTASKDGYEFAGWYTEKDGGSKVTFQKDGKVKDLGENGATITVYAKFTALPRNAVFDAGEGIFTDTNVKQKTVVALTDAQITPPTINPTRTGYEFKGWATVEGATASQAVDFESGEEKMPANGITYYAIWVASDSIKVTFYANGGAFKNTTNPDTKISYAEYDSTTALDEIAAVMEMPTKTGYSFLGWSRDKTATAADTTLGTVNLVNGIDVYAVWSKNSYELVIDPNNGKDKVEYTAANENAIPYGDDISTKIDNVTTVKAGYHFDGWDITGDDTVDKDVPTTMPAYNLTLKAIYTAEAQKVVFDAGDGTFADAKVKTLWINTDASITLPEKEPTRAGYSFAGWDVDGNGVADNVTNFTVPAGGITIKALWTTGETEYKIEYYYADVNNNYLSKAEDKDIVTSKGESDKEIDISASIKAAPEGYVLDTDKSVLKGVVSSTETLVLKVYFKRVVNEVTFNANGGYFGDDTTATADVVKNTIYGATFTAPTVDRVGYSFAGWTYNGNTYTAEEVKSLTMPSYPINFTAEWNPCDYGVLYEFKDNVIWSDTATYGKTYTVKSITEGEYVITKWTIKDTELTYDAASTANSFIFNYTDIITLVGDPNTEQSGNFTATFDPNGGTFEGKAAGESYIIKDLATGDTITAPADPTKTGYTFKGWDSTVATMGTEDVTFTATWKAKEIPITFYDADGTTPLDEEVYDVKGYYATVGETVEVPVVDTEGKNLSYWTFSYTDPATGKEVSFNIYGAAADQAMPATDATSIKAVAHWDADLYTVTFKPNGGAITGATTEADGSYKASIAVGDSISNAAPKITNSTVLISFDGYELVGWDSDDDGNANYSYDFKSIKDSSDAIMGSENATFTAIWTKATYVVNYYVNGEVANNDKGYYLDPYKVLSYTNGDLNITQWTYDDKKYSAGETITGVPTNVTEINLYAVQPTHTATFDPNGGTIEGKAAGESYVISGLKAGDTITAPANPTKFGYEFKSWDPSFSGLMGDKDVTYTAVWNAKTVTVKYYESNDDTNPYEGTVTVDDIIASEPGVRQNAEFDHWVFTYTDAEGTEQTLDVSGDGNEKMPATESEVKAVAVWTYSVTFDANSGAFPETVTTETDGTYILLSLSEGDNITAPASPAKSGSKFDGWKYYKIDKEGDVTTEEYTGTAMPAYNLKAVAQYTEETTETVVKLMPAEDNETVMIERGDGHVETYCQDTITGFNNAKNAAQQRMYAPYGVKSVTKAFDTTYGNYTFDPEDYSTWYVYGFKKGLTSKKVAAMLKVTGDGRMEIKTRQGIKDNYIVGTGTEISIYDQNGTPEDKKDDILVEKFYVVIFGDINKDGAINSTDTIDLSKELKAKKWSYSKSESYTPYLVRAANINGDTSVNSTDIIELQNVLGSSNKAINQTVGRIKQSLNSASLLGVAQKNFFQTSAKTASHC